ncbi:MAG: hypothetical protein J6V25_05790 [Oscillospiraceae bacterium]|nr:hypothetical protein [Oscillospiraceae bacterium]
MKKKIILMMLILAALLLSGCGLRTVEEMYALPRRSSEYSQLQAAIDNAMSGMTYSSPVSGENRQTVQMADLDGDGVEEYLIFAADNSEKPLKVLIFAQMDDGSVRLVETIENNGAAFEQVDYVELDENPGCELVIGRQVSDQVLKSVSVYTYRAGEAQQQLLIGYSSLLTCDLDSNGRKELMVIRPGENHSRKGMVVLYSFRDGQLQRSVETELSRDPSNVRRITQGKLQDGTPAVYVASVVDDQAVVTDVYALRQGKFTNITYSAEADTSIGTLRNYYVFADDIDEDGVLEIPGILNLGFPSVGRDSNEDFLLRWYSVDVNGLEMDKLYTFHNFGEGWYIELDSGLINYITVDQWGNSYLFYAWDEVYGVFNPVYSIFVLTGADRDEEALRDGRFALYRTETVAFAAKLEAGAEQFGITEDSLVAAFHMIRQDWRTGETQ